MISFQKSDKFPSLSTLLKNLKKARGEDVDEAKLESIVKRAMFEMDEDNDEEGLDS